MIIKVHIFVFKDYGIATFQYGPNEEENKKAIELLCKESETNYLWEIDTENVKSTTKV